MTVYIMGGAVWYEVIDFIFIVVAITIPNILGPYMRVYYTALNLF